MNFDQLMIFLCSGGSIFFIAGRKPIYGFILGLIGQPFWFYTAYTKNQPAILILAFWYTACHIRGIVREWKKRSPHQIQQRDQQSKARKLLEQVDDLGCGNGIEYKGPTGKLGFRCRHCDQFGTAPYQIIHRDGCLVIERNFLVLISHRNNLPTKIP
jgi:hypothetical protein